MILHFDFDSRPRRPFGVVGGRRRRGRGRSCGGKRVGKVGFLETSGGHALVNWLTF